MLTAKISLPIIICLALVTACGDGKTGHTGKSQSLTAGSDKVSNKSDKASKSSPAKSKATSKKSISVPRASLILGDLKEVKPLKDPSKYKPENTTKNGIKALALALEAQSLATSGALEKASLKMKEAKALDANNPRVLNVEGNILYEQNKLNDAGFAYFRACQLDRNYYASWVNLSTVYMQLGRYQDATKVLEFVTRLNPDDTNSWIGLGTMYIQFRDGNRAETCLKKALALNPNSFEALFSLGFDYHCMKNLKEAEKCYLSALKIKNNDRNAWLYLSRVQMELGKREESAKSMRKVAALEAKEVEDNPERAQNSYTIDPAYAKATALIIEGKTKEAKAVLEEAIKNRPDRPENYIGLANIEISAGRHVAAEALLNKAAKYSDGYLDLTELTVQCMLSAGKTREAIAKLEKVLKKNSKDYRLICLCAHAYFKEKNYKKAKELAENATRISANHSEAWIVLSNVAGVNGKYLESIDALKKAVHANPRESSKLWLILIHHLLAEGRQMEAVKALEKASILYPNNPNIYLAYGLVLRNKDNLKDAEKNLKQATALNPDSAYAWRQLALVLENEGDGKGRALALKKAAAAKDQSDDLSVYEPGYEIKGRMTSERKRWHHHQDNADARQRATEYGDHHHHDHSRRDPDHRHSTPIAPGSRPLLN